MVLGPWRPFTTSVDRWNIPAPVPAQSNRIKAAYRNGVLEIHLPKAEEVKPKEIKIDVM